MQKKDSRGARRAAALEVWRETQDPASSFPDFWKALNDEAAEKRRAAQQKNSLKRRAA